MNKHRLAGIKIANLFLFTFLFIQILRAQDSQFSQYYAAPLHLSPAFAGSTGGGRAVGIYRLQWPFIKSYHTSSLSVDYNFPLLNSGVGIMAYNEIAGTPNLQRTTIAGNYAYNFLLTKKLSIRTGIAGLYNRIGFNFNSLKFGDQMFSGLDKTQEQFPTTSKGYFDASASTIAISRVYWLGITISHLLTPNESVTGQSSNIPMKALVFGGGKIDLNGRIGRDNEKSITYGFLYRSQAKFDQLDIGAYYMKMPLVLGVWYRSLVGLKSNPSRSINHDAFIFIIGYRRKTYGIGYSYDLTISRLYMSGGAHEISFQYLFLQDREAKRRDKRVVVPCPRF